MTNQPYSKREEDAFRAEVRSDLKAIKDQVTYTNGKIRRIILALVGLACFSVGLGMQQLAPFIGLFF